VHKKHQPGPRDRFWASCRAGRSCHVQLGKPLLLCCGARRNALPSRATIAVALGGHLRQSAALSSSAVSNVRNACVRDRAGRSTSSANSIRSMSNWRHSPRRIADLTIGQNPQTPRLTHKTMQWHSSTGTRHEKQAGKESAPCTRASGCDGQAPPLQVSNEQPLVHQQRRLRALAHRRLFGPTPTARRRLLAACLLAASSR
jgi:hypothetical protein